MMLYYVCFLLSCTAMIGVSETKNHHLIKKNCTRGQVERSALLSLIGVYSFFLIHEGLIDILTIFLRTRDVDLLENNIIFYSMEFLPRHAYLAVFLYIVIHSVDKLYRLLDYPDFKYFIYSLCGLQVSLLLGGMFFKVTSLLYPQRPYIVPVESLI